MTIFGDDRSGFTINARIAARTAAEHRTQEGLGTRWIPWDELDARAGEIVGLVDEVVGEVSLPSETPRLCRGRAARKTILSLLRSTI
ncbi:MULTISPECIES: hypothetical protein [unclassified Bradyrhizobium]|uniref:hypothetical protein n=1 Tax=unclassified Bradyrhizobium TaxID=2631580 RepID=UPI0033921738